MTILFVNYFRNSIELAVLKERPKRKYVGLFFRCFYTAQSYHNGMKLKEAIALYDKAISYVNTAVQLAASSQKTLFIVSCFVY